MNLQWIYNPIPTPPPPKKKTCYKKWNHHNVHVYIMYSVRKDFTKIKLQIYASNDI